ncbi:MAG: DNA-3-methyladenine glycosylase [Flammeovirgaceae bacterium]|nr:DNA-3-methyladenine glycosylase [Flammeovirgaceae bacterium]
MKLSEDFYQRPDVAKIARELLGKILTTKVNGFITGGMIVETEAYSWKERGCHAFGDKKTNRNAVMFEKGGLSYVYLCYGIHNLFNVVTNKAGIADAVLIRAIEPVKGHDIMLQRRNIKTMSYQLSSGPGKLTKALGIDRSFNGKDLGKSEIWIEDDGIRISNKQIEISSRIGIAYAKEDAELPWRFCIAGNKYISQ